MDDVGGDGRGLATPLLVPNQVRRTEETDTVPLASLAAGSHLALETLVTLPGCRTEP